VTAVDSLMLDAKQAIMEEHQRRFQTLQQEGRWEEALQQIHVTLSCATDLLMSRFESSTKPLRLTTILLPTAPLPLPQPRSDWVAPLPSPPSHDEGIVHSTISDGADSCYDRSAVGPGSQHAFA
jgi:hypothetical protein